MDDTVLLLANTILGRAAAQALTPFASEALVVTRRDPEELRLGSFNPHYS